MNDDFIPHNGGPCPCHPKDIVHVEWRNGDIHEDVAVGWIWDWNNDIDDIVAYKIVKTSIEVEQEKFEKTFPNLPHEKTNSGDYAAEKTQYTWEGWRARSENF